MTMVPSMDSLCNSISELKQELKEQEQDDEDKKRKSWKKSVSKFGLCTFSSSKSRMGRPAESIQSICIVWSFEKAAEGSRRLGRGE